MIQELVIGGVCSLFTGALGYCLRKVVEQTETVRLLPAEDPAPISAPEPVHGYRDNANPEPEAELVVFKPEPSPRKLELVKELKSLEQEGESLCDYASRYAEASRIPFNEVIPTLVEEMSSGNVEMVSMILKVQGPHLPEEMRERVVKWCSIQLKAAELELAIEADQ